MTPRKVIWVAAALLLAGAPAAEAGQKMKTARFKASLQGTVAVDWALNTTRYDGCTDSDLHTDGEGRERVSFRTAQPVRVDAVGFGHEMVLSPRKGAIPVRGTVDRDGALTVHDNGRPSYCGGVEEPQEPPASDCGTRTWRGTVTTGVIAWDQWPEPFEVVPYSSVLELAGPVLRDGSGLGSLYGNCPGGDAGIVLTADSYLPEKRLFSRRKRIVVRGTHNANENIDGFMRTIDVKWRMTLERVKPAKRRR